MIERIARMPFLAVYCLRLYRCVIGPARRYRRVVELARRYRCAVVSL